jgi:hypothetical protein
MLTKSLRCKMLLWQGRGPSKSHPFLPLARGRGGLKGSPLRFGLLANLSKKCRFIIYSRVLKVVLYEKKALWVKLRIHFWR